MAAVNGYGPQNGCCTPQLRPQFRRQGSSFGPGAINNMAVMVVPNKVDYSVTKGGIRIWAVLFVFIFLCSAMLTVFTDIDDDDDKAIHQSTFDDDDSEPANNLNTPRIVEDDDLDDDEAADNPPDRGPHDHTHVHSYPHYHHKHNQPKPETAPLMDKEETDIPKEEVLFARLREKVAAQRQRKHEATEMAEESNNANTEPVPQKQKKRRRVLIEDEGKVEASKVVHKEAKTDPTHQNEDDDAETEQSLTKEQRKSSKKRRQAFVEEEQLPVKEEFNKKRRKTKVVVVADEGETKSDSEVKKAEKSGKKHSMLTRKQNEIKPDNEDNNNNNGDDDKDVKSDANNDDDDDDDTPIPTAQPVKTRPLRVVKKRASSWHKSVEEKDYLVPRKNLLKHNKKKSLSVENLKDDDNDDDDDDDVDESDDDDGDNDDDDDNESSEKLEKPIQTHDVTTIRKRSNPYNRKAVTNRDDFKHRKKLDAADFLLEKHEFDKASKLYDEVLASNIDSPRSHFGKARCFQLRSEFEDNDHLLDAAIAEYQFILDNDDTPEELFRITAEKVIECSRFRGNLHKVMMVQRILLDHFPENVALQNDFGITFLMMGRIEDARNVFNTVLQADSNNPIAMAYLGYILKVHDGKLEKGILYMRKGLKAATEPLIDGKFYFHLGDGLMRLGRYNDAKRIYEEATHLGLFPSAIQRSTHNLDGLVARPWWSLDQTGCGKYLRQIERQWVVIHQEIVKVFENDSNLWESQNNHWTDGKRETFYLIRNRKLDIKRCSLLPNTCAIIKQFIVDAICFKGNVRLSVLYSGSRIWPHCATLNYVLEAQLGIVVPFEARIRVGTETKGWKTGKFIVFDGSFEHEVWFDGAEAISLVLTIDLWHPEVPSSNRGDDPRE